MIPRSEDYGVSHSYIEETSFDLGTSCLSGDRHGPVAQWIEQQFPELRVGGSIPFWFIHNSIKIVSKNAGF